MRLSFILSQNSQCFSVWKLYKNIADKSVKSIIVSSEHDAAFMSTHVGGVGESYLTSPKDNTTVPNYFEERKRDLSAALSTISYGHTCSTSLLASFLYFYKNSGVALGI